MSTKGLIRTLEAVIAVLLILALLFFILPEEEIPTGEVPAQVKNAQRFVLEEIALDKNHRNCITGDAAYQGKCEQRCPQINAVILQNIPFGYAATCEICNSAISCAGLNLPAEKSIYADSIFISRNTVNKVVRVYYYEK